MTTDQASDWPHPGARWWKFDFHTHTPASSDSYWHGRTEADGGLTPEQWLQRFMSAGVDCVVVADHNSGAWIDRLKAGYESMRERSDAGFRELHLFPGVEISVNGGFHLLAVLPTDKTTADVDSLLGSVGYAGTKGSSDGVTRESAPAVIDAVLDAGGIPIPAHVDSPKGLLRVREARPASPELDAGTLRQVLGRTDLVAMEVVDPSSPRPALWDELKPSWSEVLGSDCHSFRGRHVPGSRYTWVKMARPSLEGLRLALLDGDGFSLRRSDDPAPFDPFATPRHWIEAVEIADARFMGHGRPARLRFNPWLNALVGGRGTGKSTVVHAVRLAARRESELKLLGDRSEPNVTFQRFNRVPTARVRHGGLAQGTVVKWTVLRDGVRHRVHWRQDGRGVVVEQDAGGGDWREALAQGVTPERFPLRIFSQGHIAALAGDDQQALLQVIDEAAHVAPLERELEQACNAFYALRARIRALDARLLRRDALVVEREDVVRKLNRFEAAGHAAVLTAYRRLGRQRGETDRQFEEAVGAARRIEGVAAELEPVDVPDGVFDDGAKEDAQATAVIGALGDALRDAGRELREAAQRLRDVAVRHRADLTGSAWQAAVEQADANYEKLVEALREEGVTDPNEYGYLTQDRARLDGELKNLESLRDERDRLVAESESALRKVLGARRAVTAARDDFLATVLAGNDFVRIAVTPYGNDAPTIERSLREALEAPDHFAGDILEMEDGRPVKGCVADLLTGPAAAPNRSVETEKRIQALKDRLCRAGLGDGDFGGFFNNHLAAKHAKTPAVFDKICTWFPDDGLRVEYSRGDGRDFGPIVQASAGQRAAAILAFLLAHGDEPLVLDQPEDDLDNHLIYDLVVRQIRRNKLRRQIVVVTHNPNIVVNGDAEMLHALDFRGGQCVVAQSGSLQEEAMREEVCRIMEGGREAFERRYRRLGTAGTGPGRV